MTDDRMGIGFDAAPFSWGGAKQFFAVGVAYYATWKIAKRRSPPPKGRGFGIISEELLLFR